VGYTQTLEVLARLHVDPRFRQSWTEDAGRALAGFALSPREHEALAGVDGRVVARAGRMMDHHREARVSEQLPWVDGAKRPALAERLLAFAADVPPELLNREESIAFCRYVEAKPDGLPAYARDVARCERLRISLAWGLQPLASGTHVEPFEYPVLEVLAALEGAGWPEVAPRPTRVEYLKVPGLPAVLVRAQAR
jgi:hypothetical protein